MMGDGWQSPENHCPHNIRQPRRRRHQWTTEKLKWRVSIVVGSFLIDKSSTTDRLVAYNEQVPVSFGQSGAKRITERPHV